jgi:hypothetical protein
MHGVTAQDTAFFKNVIVAELKLSCIGNENYRQSSGRKRIGKIQI